MEKDKGTEAKPVCGQCGAELMAWETVCPMCGAGVPREDPESIPIRETSEFGRPGYDPLAD